MIGCDRDVREVHDGRRFVGDETPALGLTSIVRIKKLKAAVENLVAYVGARECDLFI